MAKCSYEFKRKIIEQYSNGNVGYKILAKKYQIGVSRIERWVSNYKHFGDEGLMRSGNKCAYNVKFKLEANTRYKTIKSKKS
ncbi:helix-turn-helix domain-containing protein [Aedoeadaptatus coli]|uniref:helix-turn-helix domain-containing protein n=1 Tax=Aedoeadaptatus coli TaxID=2058292 RepID=UPI000D554F2D